MAVKAKIKEVKLLGQASFMLEPTEGQKVGVKGHRYLFCLTFIHIRLWLLNILVERSLGQRSNFA